MDRINGANTVDIGGGKRGFRDRNLVAGLAGTQVTAAHMNAMQEELMAVIEAAGLTPAGGSWTQLLAALDLMYGGAGSLGGTGWWRLPGGLILQWGSAVLPNSGSQTASIAVTFPVAFPTQAFIAVGNATRAANTIVGYPPSIDVTSLSATGATFRGDVLQADTSFNQTVPIYWFAVGG